MTRATITGTAVPFGTDIPALVRGIVVKHLCCDPLPADKLDARTLRELGADSLDTIELAMAIEDALDMRIGEFGLTADSTVAQLIAFTERKVHGK